MEKLSLYNLLSILLPGSLFVFVGYQLLYDLKTPIFISKMDPYFGLALYLSISIFVGVITHIITFWILGFYKKIGIHTPIYEVYKHSKTLKATRPFYEKHCKKHFDSKTKGECFKDNLDVFYDNLYYTLEIKGIIEMPKAFQSFYFFFRNFFTMSILLIIFTLIVLVIKDFEVKYQLMLAVLFGVLTISYFAARWYRKKMVEKMLWVFYVYKNEF